MIERADACAFLTVQSTTSRGYTRSAFLIILKKKSKKSKRAGKITESKLRRLDKWDKVILVK